MALNIFTESVYSDMPIKEVILKSIFFIELMQFQQNEHMRATSWNVNYQEKKCVCFDTPAVDDKPMFKFLKHLEK